MKHKKLFAWAMLALGGLVLCATASAQKSDKDKGEKSDKDKNEGPGPYSFLTTITIPGGLTGFDISWVDSERARYYLANRGNPAGTPPVGPNIPVINTERDELLYEIPLSNAPNGIVAIHRDGNDEGHDGAGTLV